MEDTNQIIFNKLKTKKRANDFLVLSGVMKSMTHLVGDFDIEKMLSNAFRDRPAWMEDILPLIPGLKSGKISIDAVNVIESVEQKIKNSTIVKIEMSFQPSDSFIEELTSVFNHANNLGEGEKSRDILIDIEIKGDLDPGAKIYVEGRLLDLSLKNQVVSYLMSKDVVNRYL